VLEKDPANVDAWTKHGNVLAAAGEVQKAIASHEKALSINPNHIEAINNRGCLLADNGHTEEALAAYERVLALDPCHAEAWINRGHMLSELHGEDDAIACYQQAIALSPHHPDAMFNMGLNQLRLGRFRLGWENLELRWFARDFIHTQRKYPLPRWSGEALDGPLLISGEQGLGDQILYASMLPDALARTPQITVEVEPRLIPLFNRSFPQVNAVAREEGRLYGGPAVAQLPIASLGRLFRPDWASFPRYADGYLRCNEALAASLRARLSDGRKVIGLSWSSRNPRYEMSKSARLHDFAALLRLPGCRFIDLQYGDTQVDREAVEQDLGVPVERLADVDNTNDLDALTSLIKACDIVVTVSNTTAHLAGALGKETYVLVPSGRGRMWFWFSGRNDDNPFYPRLHVMQQKPKQPWAALVAGISAKVAAKQ
jgi:ADP-heptose:LPS heptosyltransferase